MKNKMKFMFTSLLGLLIICNFSAFSLIDGAITYQVNHFGYMDDPKIVYWGGTEDEGSVYATTDENGYLYVTCFSNSFGITEDVCVIKYDSHNMSVLWNVTWETNDNARPSGIVIGSKGNAYVGGTINTEYSPGNFTQDAFIAKFSHNGTKLWDYIRHDPTLEDEVTSVSIRSDYIYLTGKTNSSQGDLFIQKYSSSGIYQDTFNYGKTTPREILTPGGTAIDNQGNFYIAASTNNTVPSNYEDLNLIKINATGHHVWNRTFGVSSYDRGVDVAIRGNNIYLVGSYGVSDAVIFNYNSSGHQIWNTTYDLPLARGISVSVNLHGNPVILGYTEEYSILGDFFMVEFLTNGSVLWEDTFQGPQVDIPSDIRTHHDWMYAVGQSFSGTNQHQVVIIKYKDHTVTQLPSIGPYGRIFGSIIGSIIVAFALLIIVGVLLTYWKKS